MGSCAANRLFGFAGGGGLVSEDGDWGLMSEDCSDWGSVGIDFRHILQPVYDLAQYILWHGC
jgi:hypothetical protein